MPEVLPLRVVFLGVTHPHARAWAVAVRNHADCLLVAAYDADGDARGRFCSEFGCSEISLAQLTSDDFDAVVVDGRNDESMRLSLAAIRAGLPVFIEKTGGMGSQELQTVADEARDRGLTTQLGYFMRYSDAYALLKDELGAGDLGEVSLARFHCAIPGSAWRESPDWFGDSSNVVGGFMEAGCHMVDLVRDLLGEPLSVSAEAVCWDRPPNGSEDALSASLRFGTAVVSLDFTAREANPWNMNWTAELYVTRQTVRASLNPAQFYSNDGHYRWHRSGASRLDDTEAALSTRAQHEYASLMERGMDRFIRAVRGIEPSPVDAASGAATLRLIESIYLAAGRPVRSQPITLTQHPFPSHDKRKNGIK